MRYALIAVIGLSLLLILGGCSQPRNLTEGDIEDRLTSLYEFEDKYLDHSDGM